MTLTIGDYGKKISKYALRKLRNKKLTIYYNSDNMLSNKLKTYHISNWKIYEINSDVPNSYIESIHEYWTIHYILRLRRLDEEFQHEYQKTELMISYINLIDLLNERMTDITEYTKSSTNRLFIRLKNSCF